MHGIRLSYDLRPSWVELRVCSPVKLYSPPSTGNRPPPPKIIHAKKKRQKEEKRSEQKVQSSRPTYSPQPELDVVHTETRALFSPRRNSRPVWPIPAGCQHLTHTHSLSLPLVTAPQKNLEPTVSREKEERVGPESPGGHCIEVLLQSSSFQFPILPGRSISFSLARQ
ncbi:hypothetical protein PDE_04929 [Penicillium oxalicum 114-2]|uniref:Uncharacterized protein n=1 Tax=Penicillium oxalicum (strain 114-2 / CGMCC 5302) TaxID=933388 RepID=S7ZI71_PENO1|nr:hypothetical protein PDE_04929 [Penicillium oxalicum 114-2]